MNPVNDVVSGAAEHLPAAAASLVTEHLPAAATAVATAVAEPDFMAMILSYRSLVLMIAIMGVIQALKAGIAKTKAKDSKTWHMVCPWLPLILGALAAFIPGVILVPTAIPVEHQLGMKILTGLVLGALSGQAWKIVKTKIEVLQGKV